MVVRKSHANNIAELDAKVFLFYHPLGNRCGAGRLDVLDGAVREFVLAVGFDGIEVCYLWEVQPVIIVPDKRLAIYDTGEFCLTSLPFYENPTTHFHDIYTLLSQQVLQQ